MWKRQGKPRITKRWIVGNLLSAFFWSRDTVPAWCNGYDSSTRRNNGYYFTLFDCLLTSSDTGNVIVGSYEKSWQPIHIEQIVSIYGHEYDLGPGCLLICFSIFKFRQSSVGVWNKHQYCSIWNGTA